MFHADMTFVLALVALVAGAFLVFMTKIHKEVTATSCKVVGYAVVVLAVVMLLFSGYGMMQGCKMRRKARMYMMHQMMHKSRMHKPGMQMMRGQMPMKRAMSRGPVPHHPRMQDMQAE